ncbi:heavy metal-associated isoprenylated plant protein 34 [Fagus crenata]
MEYQYHPHVMDPHIGPQTHVFRLPCLKCQRRVRQLLSKLHGVYSIEVDGESGRVSVTTEIDPHTLAERLEGIMYHKRELPHGAIHIPSLHPVNNYNTHVAAGHGTNNPNGVEQFRDFQIAELQELAKLERLKHVELIQSRTLKMTFNDYKGGHHDVQCEKKDGPNLKPTNAAGPSHFEASSCYYGGGGSENVNGNAMKNLPHHIFNIDFNRPPPSPPTIHAPQGYPPVGYPPQGQAHPTAHSVNAHYADVSCGDLPKCIVM